MSKSKKATTAKSVVETPVVNIETATPAAEVPQGTSKLAEAAGSVKALLVKPDTTGGVGKLTAVKATKKEEDAIPSSVLEELETLNLNTVNKIKTLYAAGFTRTQIIAAGYNSSTVYRQVGEYIKKLAEIKSERVEVKNNAEEIAAATDIKMPVNADADEDAADLENE